MDEHSNVAEINKAPRLARHKVYIGGFNLSYPGWAFDRFGGTIPLGRLVLSGSTAVLGGIVRMPSVTLDASTTTIFRTRGVWASPGVGFNRFGKKHYFVTFRPNQVMAALVRAGFLVTADEKPELRDVNFKGPSEGSRRFQGVSAISSASFSDGFR